MKPTSTLPKERLAFVSGNILVFALLLIQLWPSMSMYQTRLNLHVWTFNTPGEGVKSELWIFWFATLVLASMASALLLAVAHIICWGFWLGLSSDLSEHEARGTTTEIIGGPTLSRLCEITYGAVFFLTFIVAVMVIVTPLVLLSSGFEQFLASSLGLSPRASGWIARMAPLAALLLIGRFFLKRLKRSELPKQLINTIGPSTFLSFVLACIILTFSWFIVIEACYTLNVNINKELFVQSGNEVVEVYMSLGGATSAHSEAELKLLDSRGSFVQKLDYQSLGEGRYLSYVSSTKLPQGRYEVVLEYPHTALKDSFPYLSRSTRKSRWFVVTP